MPTNRLGKYLDQLPVLEAERDLSFIAATAAGSGAMPEADQRQYLRDLRRAARGGPRVQRASAATFAALGIAVEDVPEKKGGE